MFSGFVLQINSAVYGCFSKQWARNVILVVVPNQIAATNTFRANSKLAEAMDAPKLMSMCGWFWISKQIFKANNKVSINCRVAFMNLNLIIIIHVFWKENTNRMTEFTTQNTNTNTFWSGASYYGLFIVYRFKLRFARVKQNMILSDKDSDNPRLKSISNYLEIFRYDRHLKCIDSYLSMKCVHYH